MSAPAAIFTLSCVALAGPLDVAVFPVGGSASPGDRQEATRALIDALRRLEGLRILSLEGLGAMLGSDVEAEIARCADDDCIRRATDSVRADRILITTVAEEGERGVLRARLVPTTTVAADAVVRVSREIPAGERRDALALALSSLALDLFPEQAKKSLGTLVLRGATPGLRVAVDGAQPRPLEQGASIELRLRPGPHTIQATAPGHHSLAREITLWLGQRTEVLVELEKNRSAAPLILGGIGGFALGAGLVFGALAQAKASDWEEACGGGRCAAGFTRARYEDDGAAIDRARLSANGLLVVAGLSVGAAVIAYLLDAGVDPEGMP